MGDNKLVKEREYLDGLMSLIKRASKYYSISLDFVANGENDCNEIIYTLMSSDGEDISFSLSSVFSEESYHHYKLLEKDLLIREDNAEILEKIFSKLTIEEIKFLINKLL